MYNTALTFNLQHILYSQRCPRGLHVVFGPWEHAVPSHYVCAVPVQPSPPHAFITPRELINEADFQLPSRAQTVQLCIFGIFLYHVLVAWWAPRCRRVWEAWDGNEPRWHELYLPESWPLPLRQIKVEWLVRLCQSVLLSQAPVCCRCHVDAGRTLFTFRVNQDARLGEGKEAAGSRCKQ